MQTSYATPPSISATSISPSLRHQHEHQQRQSHRFGSQTPSPQYQHAAALSAPVAPQARLAPSPRGLPQDLESALWSGGTNGSIASLTPPGTPPPWSRSSRTSDQHLTSAETTASPRPFIPPPQPYLAEFSPTDSGIGSSKGSGPHPISTSQSSSQHSQIQFRQSSSTSISNVSGSGSSFSSSPSPSSYHHTTLSRRFILAFVVSGVCLGIPLFFLDRRQWPQRRSPATLRHGPRHSGSLFIFAVLVNLVAAVLLCASIICVNSLALDGTAQMAAICTIIFTALSLASTMWVILTFQRETLDDRRHTSFAKQAWSMQQSINFSLPLIFLEYAIVSFGTAICVYRFQV